ncbi:Helix-turn-helix, type 11 domain protein [Candidatus Magnetobacterium bavaricum]|uniref:Helix-turn-helix, type 11 domain protein n=1 Tax=Candidatus Magnetobacterium bavaricum TaxID=29290 RepID=A0A0F3GJN4_9BACT|nr:Helix-turn-helix, type 11 domain protein [Candidatus Magnetobacterium bavaricum]
MYAYNPRKLTHAQLKDYFVGRWGLVNDIKSELDLAPGQSPRQHWMLIGPRGMGKSHLLTLLYHEIKADPRLKDLWLPILFPEELMSVYNIADFLERTLKEIVSELGSTHPEVVGELQGRIGKIKALKANERANYGFSLLTWVHGKTGRFVLLLTENLQQLLGKKFSAIEQKQLRAYLQTSDAVLIIGSATTIFKEIRDHALPFYDFFYSSTLKELTHEDIRLLVNKLLEDCDDAKNSPDLDAKLRTICSLAGGNPRMVVFLADIIKADVTQDVLDIMDRLLDELTPYFNTIFGDLPENMLKIINVMAAHEPALSPSTIAKHLEMDEATVRNYMKTLKDNGYVRIALKKGTSHYYCLNEYMYRIWFQMRDSGHREEMRWLIEFLLMLYGTSAVSDKARRFREGEMGDVYSLFYRRLVIATDDFAKRNRDYCNSLELLTKLLNSGEDEKEMPESIDVIYEHIKLERYYESIVMCDKAIEISPNDYRIYVFWGYCLGMLKRYDEAISMYKKAIEISPNAIVYGLWGDCLTTLEKYDEAILAYLKLFQTNKELLLAQNDNDLYSTMIHSTLTLLTPGDYIQQFYAKKGAKHSRPTLLTFLLLLEKYDIVEEHLSEIITQAKTTAPSEDIALLFSAIKLSIYLNLPKENTDNISRLLPLYTTYIKSLSSHNKQEQEIKGLAIGIYKLYLINKANANAIDKTLNHLKTSDVPFGDAILKIWTCISDPESHDAKLYLTDKALSEVVKQLHASI